MSYMTDVRRRAGNGARFLDQYLPNWFNKIKTSELDLGSGAYCVVGQLNKQNFQPDDFCERLVQDTVEVENASETKDIGKSLRIPGFTAQETRDITVSVRIDTDEMGFDDGDNNYGLLTEAWLEEIHKRRDAQKKARVAKKSAVLAGRAGIMRR